MLLPGRHVHVRGPLWASLLTTVMDNLGAGASSSRSGPAGASGLLRRPLGSNLCLTFLGDTMLGRLVSDRLKTWRVNPGYVWGNTLPQLLASDARVLNLETAITDYDVPWSRTPKVFHFRSSPEVATPALRAARVDAVVLANNHCLDYEVQGLQDTIRCLDEAGIPHAGAGMDQTSARAPAWFTIKVPALDAEMVAPPHPRYGHGHGPGQADNVPQPSCTIDVRVALLALTDNEPGWKAGPSTPGVNYLVPDPRPHSESMTWVRQAVADARAQGADMVILSNHWGGNWVMRPSSTFKAFARACMSVGVDLYFGHSAHVTQGVEMWRADEAQGQAGASSGAMPLVPAALAPVAHPKPILYATGDWIDDYAVDEDWRNDWSMAFRLHYRAAGHAHRLAHGAASTAAGQDTAEASSSSTAAPSALAPSTPELLALELLPARLSFAQTNWCLPGHPDYEPMTARMTTLCGELGTGLHKDEDGHLWHHVKHSGLMT